MHFGRSLDASVEIWTGPDGKHREMIRGKCARCTSVMLIEPSEHAIEVAKARMAVADEMRKMAGDGAGLPPVRPAEGTMADGPA